MDLETVPFSIHQSIKQCEIDGIEASLPTFEEWKRDERVQLHVIIGPAPVTLQRPCYSGRRA